MVKITGIRKKKDNKNVKMSRKESDNLARKLMKQLEKNGIGCEVNPETSSRLNVTNCRFTQKYVDKYGYNQSPFTNRKGKVLGWQDWVEFNNTLNDTLDNADVSANIKSLGGKFNIRAGDKRFDEDDWERLSYEDVGGSMSPVIREDAWASRGKGREGWRRERAKRKARGK